MFARSFFSCLEKTAVLSKEDLDRLRARLYSAAGPGITDDVAKSFARSERRRVLAGVGAGVGLAATAGYAAKKLIDRAKRKREGSGADSPADSTQKTARAAWAGVLDKLSAAGVSFGQPKPASSAGGLGSLGRSAALARPPRNSALGRVGVGVGALTVGYAAKKLIDRFTNKEN